MNSAVLGMAIVLVAGAVGSATLLPMKFVRRWHWENTWLLYSLHAYFLLPLLIAWWTIPEITSVYAEAGIPTITLVAVYGLGWGLSVVLLGRAVDAVGLAVSNGIILGCSIAVGSLAPLLIVDPGRLATPAGVKIVAVDAVILCGVVACAWAAYLRERSGAEHAGAASATDSHGVGLAICFLAGLLTPLINIALASGERITQSAERLGASSDNSNNGVWALTLCAGAVPSLAWCSTLLLRNRTWSGFSQPGSWRNVGLCILMAAIFFTSTVAYGIGAKRLGALGTVYGWPVYISSIIVGNSLWGWLTGEWTGASQRSGIFMVVGLLLQIAGIMLLFSVSQGGGK
jgi:L-rhamnose-H+ transport protein